ncbi:recombinase family protein [Stutzerimonas sp. R75]|uniref:recombinase family protein n=1 Tax=Stutzerimonas sp. R75 TaxID=3439498 RepID=UPI00406CE265
MNAHLYLRASTKDQDADRALASLQAFAIEHSLNVASTHSENISGTRLDRPALNTLLDSAKAGDVLLVESVDRLSRLSQADWSKLKAVIEAKGLKLVVADLPTSHMLVDDQGITGQIMQVINSMLIDLMATMARLDQEKRVERIKQGLENKKARGEKVGGKGRNQEAWKRVESLLKRGGLTVEEIAKLAGVGVATVYRIKRELQPA